MVITICLAAAAVAAVHLFWRRRFRLARETSAAELARLESEAQSRTQALRDEQQALFNSMIEGVLLLDENGRVLLANHRFMELFGISRELRGRTLLEVLRQHELAELLERVSEEKQVLGFELHHTGFSNRCLEINAAVVSDREGAPRRTVLVFHDLTRLKQLERTREEFVANVSHELRTPLSLIKGYTETLLEGARDDPEITAKFLRTIQRNAERLQFLIEDLLTISELESGRLKMNCETVPLRSVVERALDDLRSQAQQRNVTLMNEAPELMVNADAERLQQVLGNLVSNAIKYGRAEGQVTVRASPADAMVEICVQDDGPGIPAEALERVFERFYRVDKARSREQGGTGLGLSIVKHIVQSHGGRVWATSEPGKGAAFFFTLPVGN